MTRKHPYRIDINRTERWLIESIIGRKLLRIKLDSNASMESELRCIRCGYDLRMLNPTGICPECATPIEQSIVYEWHADRIAHDRFRSACLIMIVALIIRLTYLLTVISLLIGTRGNASYLNGWALYALTPWPTTEMFRSIYALKAAKGISGIILTAEFVLGPAMQMFASGMLMLCLDPSHVRRMFGSAMGRPRVQAFG